MQEVKQDKEPGIEVLRQGCNTMVERNIEWQLLCKRLLLSEIS